MTRPPLPKPANPEQYNGHGGEFSSPAGWSAEQMHAYYDLAAARVAELEAQIEALGGVPALSAGPAIKPLEWSAESGPTDKIRYNHITAETALGQFSVEWKGWKEEDAPCIYLAGDYIGFASDVDGAKQLAERHIRDIVASLLAASPPAEQQAQPGAVDRTGCTAGTDEECTRRGCATTCPALQAAPKAAPGGQQNCGRCCGSGEDPAGYYDQSRGDAGSTFGGPCRECNGTGEAPQQGVQEPVATVIKKGADRQWMSERLGALPDGIYSLYLAPQPAPATLSERDAFEAAWEKLHGKRPVLWSQMFASHKMETPAHSEGKYFAASEQAAWKLWRARAALAAQGGKV